MKSRMDGLFARGLLSLVAFSLFGVALVGIATFFVSRNLQMVTREQLVGPDGAALLPAETITLLASRATALVAGAGMIAATLLVVGRVLSARRIHTRYALLQRQLTGAAQGDLSQPISVPGRDELNSLARGIDRVVTVLHEQVAEIETAAADRCAVLEQRVLTYQAVGRVVGVVSAIRDLPEMLSTAATLIVETLGVDHAGLFLVDEATLRPVLRAVSSEVTHRLLIRRQDSGDDPVVQAIVTGRPQTVRNVEADAPSVASSESSLPRSCLAVPLKVHDRVVGAIDIQCMRDRVFTQDDVAALSLLADQIALAIENARLAEESRQVAEVFRRRYGERAVQDWAQRAEAGVMAFHFTGLEVVPVEAEPSYVCPDRVEIAERADGMRELRAPIVVGDQILGSVAFRQPLQAPQWGEADLAFVAAVCGHVGQALERARLLDEVTARDAWRQRQDRLTERIWMSATDVDRVLETTIRELGAELGAKGTIRLRTLSDWRAGMGVSDVSPADGEPADA